MAESTQQQLCKSKNGVSITYNPVQSHAATHIEDTPDLKDLIVEAANKISLDGQEVATHIDMKRVVGKCDVVKVDESDDIVYAARKNRKEEGLVPFTKSRQGEPCSYVSLHLVPHPDGTYELSSAWIGTFDDDDEPFPQASNATDNSKNFWNKHAFVWGSQEIIQGTETTIRPW